MTPIAYLLQRGSAAIMAPLVFTHLIVIVYAVQGGLTAEEILGRTRGSVAWGAFYVLFVLTASLHASIGLQTILREWGRMGRRGAAVLGHGTGAIFVLLGLGAVYAVVMA